MWLNGLLWLVPNIVGEIKFTRNRAVKQLEFISERVELISERVELVSERAELISERVGAKFV